MFAQCSDPASLDGLAWLWCYLTTGKHLLFYRSFAVVLILLFITAPVALAFGFGGATAARSRLAPLRLHPERRCAPMPNARGPDPGLLR